MSARRTKLLPSHAALKARLAARQVALRCVCEESLAVLAHIGDTPEKAAQRTQKETEYGEKQAKIEAEIAQLKRQLIAEEQSIRYEYERAGLRASSSAAYERYRGDLSPIPHPVDKFNGARVTNMAELLVEAFATGDTEFFQRFPVGYQQSPDGTYKAYRLFSAGRPVHSSATQVAWESLQAAFAASLKGGDIPAVSPPFDGWRNALTGIDVTALDEAVSPAFMTAAEIRAKGAAALTIPRLTDEQKDAFKRQASLKTQAVAGLRAVHDLYYQAERGIVSQVRQKGSLSLGAMDEKDEVFDWAGIASTAEQQFLTEFSNNQLDPFSLEHAHNAGALGLLALSRSMLGVVSVAEPDSDSVPFDKKQASATALDDALSREGHDRPAASTEGPSSIGSASSATAASAEASPDRHAIARHSSPSIRQAVADLMGKPAVTDDALKSALQQSVLKLDDWHFSRTDIKYKEILLKEGKNKPQEKELASSLNACRITSSKMESEVFAFGEAIQVELSKQPDNKYTNGDYNSELDSRINSEFGQMGEALFGEAASRDITDCNKMSAASISAFNEAKKSFEEVKAYRVQYEVQNRIRDDMMALHEGKTKFDAHDKEVEDKIVFPCMRAREKCRDLIGKYVETLGEEQKLFAYLDVCHQNEKLFRQKYCAYALNKPGSTDAILRIQAAAKRFEHNNPHAAHLVQSSLVFVRPVSAQRSRRVLQEWDALLRLDSAEAARRITAIQEDRHNAYYGLDLLDRRDAKQVQVQWFRPKGVRRVDVILEKLATGKISAQLALAQVAGVVEGRLSKTNKSGRKQQTAQLYGGLFRAVTGPATSPTPPSPSTPIIAPPPVNRLRGGRGKGGVV